MMASVYPTNSHTWYSFFPDFGKFEYINLIHVENGSFSTVTGTGDYTILEKERDR
ncbi:hypothetical protein NIES37_59520 [Tolypothrix tenuis PCC 7101]|uniref:Uncharacterized protein n=1 Tax=Tolypothrix tenuis PCC 7101 TaxID=231146 RepID=A0A1Z4N8C0_9CYAN|nr:hypothetical protein NIES37_59520 [Tolypothrix tenuis PCC 7101]BAZ74130.1 hypothetical protein NIES50_27010 [Aulosira laxa NIES-50]